MSRIPLTWRVFIAIQLLAAASWVGMLFCKSVALLMRLWTVQFVLELPGNLISEQIVGHLLHLQLRTYPRPIGIAVTVFAIIATNALIWFIPWIVSRLVNRRAAIRP
jgi:hypothetical protein